MDIKELFPIQNQHSRFLLGLYISRKRQELGLSAAALAAQLNLDQKTYARLEGGHKKMDPLLFEKLQFLLSLEAAELIELQAVAKIRYINDLSKVMVPNFPHEA